MSLQPQPPVWFITAASSGFGQAIALEALSRGHRVIATARSTSRLTTLQAAGATCLTLDITWPLPRLQEVATQANEVYGRIDHVVNAAGYILVGAVEETSPQEDIATFQTNVLGTLNVCKALLPYLRSSPFPHKTIANFGSIASWRGGPGYALYCGTKWAVSGISESLRAELAPLGIAVTVVEPGYFRTGFLNEGAQIKSEKVVDVYEKSAVGKVRRGLGQMSGSQKGDVGKGARVLVDVLCMEGVAQGRQVPERIVLGRDAQGVVRGKCEETVELVGEWEGVTSGTDWDE